ncbi:MAG: hypothetical protein JXQ71_14345 [Verrucomicrobia bacterium]|nr:hypothetical protein [Verrucomicrobiota bacterium]
MSGAPQLIVYAPYGITNRIDCKPVLEGDTKSWQHAFDAEIPANNLCQTISLTPTNRTLFYRAIRGQ